MADDNPIPLSKKCMAEFLGAFTLLFGGLGTGVLLSYFSGVGYANPANTGFIALAVGGSIAWGIYAWGNISGGHYNPGVTLTFALAGRMPWRDVIPYWVSQVLGGVTGLGIIYGILAGYPGGTGHAGIAYATAMGADGYAGNSSPYLFSAGAVVLLEIAASFLFYVVIMFATDKFSVKGFHGLAIGGILSIMVLVGLNIDGGGYNPARSTASAVWAAVAGLSWPGIQLWAFWVGPFIGGALAAFVWRVLNCEPKDESAATADAKPAAKASSQKEK